MIERLVEKPIMSVADVREITGTTFPAANDVVQRMVGLGIWKEITGRTRNRNFFYEPYVKLFNS